MKRTVVIFIVLAALAGAGGYAAVNQWHTKKYQAKVAAQQVADTDAAQAIAHAREIQADKAEARRTVYVNLKSQCDKGRLAYDALPATLKPKFAMPTCGQPGDLETIAL